MHADRSDALSQIVTSKLHRRGAVRALLGFAAGGALAPALAERVAARKKKRKNNPNPCGPCQRRRKGRCRGAKPNDAQCGECGICADGLCVPSSLGDCPACQECAVEGRCTPAADDTPCLGDGHFGKCLEGTCNEPPACERATQACDPEGLPCCSGACRFVPGNGSFCSHGASGALCLDSDDCAGELTCIGYRCG